MKTQASTKDQPLRQVRDIWDVTTYGLSPAKLLASADKQGYIPGAPPPSAKQVKLVCEYLRECARHTKTIRRGPGRDSYSMRQYIRAWYGRKYGNPEEFYVSNGAVIAAALAEGYRAVRASPDSPNAFFDMALAVK